MYDQKFLEDLINNRIEEDLNLDYKASGALERSDKKANEISKDISAMANSDGGKIIYGITENEHLPEKIDPINRDEISKEWLEQIIQGRIRPKVEGVRIYPVEIDSNANKVVFIVDIPQSSTAHQASDKKYYRRHNFNSIPMYDYEIRDIFNRAKSPKIQLKFEIWYYNYKVGGKEHPLTKIKSEEKTVIKFILKPIAENIGKVLAKYINCYIKIPEVIFKDKFHEDNTESIREFKLDNKFKELLDVDFKHPAPKKTYSPAKFEPLLPTGDFILENDFPELHQFYRDYSQLEIPWTIYADNSEPIVGKIKIEDIEMIRIKS